MAKGGIGPSFEALCCWPSGRSKAPGSDCNAVVINSDARCGGVDVHIREHDATLAAGARGLMMRRVCARRLICWNWPPP